MTYAEGDTVHKVIRQPNFSAPLNLPPNIEKYSLYRYPGLGEIRYHYGHANDPKYYQSMTHGMKSDEKSFVSFLIKFNFICFAFVDVKYLKLRSTSVCLFSA